MKKLLLPLLAFVLFCSHDMFLKLDTYFLQPNSDVTIKLFNGTWEESDNVIARNRMIDVSLVGNGERTRLDTTKWTESGKTTLLNITTGKPGTWVAGLSTRSRDFGQTAEAFNRYLKHDGVIDMIAARERDGTTNDPVVERYSKHVKAIYQVGDKLTDDFMTPLGYPIEFVPLANPYKVAAGEFLRVQLLRDGEPLPNQVVYAVTEGSTHTHAGGEEHSHDEEDGDHTHTSGTQLRTNESGIIIVPLEREGITYLRTIHMETKDTGGLTHESNWATLTFEVGHGHAHGAHAHGEGEHTHDDGSTHSHGDGDHAHEDETLFGLPSYVYYLGSFVLVAGLFFWFNRKSA